MTLPTRLAALLAAAATALTLNAAPAAADLDRDDAVKILGGIAALYLLNEALQRENRRDQRRSEPEVQVQPRETARAPRAGETYSHIHEDGSGGGVWHEHSVGIPHSQADHGAPSAPAPLPEVTRSPLPAPIPLPTPRDRVEVKLLPEQCRADVSNIIETIEGYDAACLQNAVALPGSLPPSCLVQHPDRTIYEATCLRREGWSSRMARN